MAVTSYIKATSAIVDSGNVVNVQNLTANFSGVATITNIANITLTFGNISSYLPSNAVITGIGFKYSGTPSNINFISQLTSTVELENPNHLPADNVTKQVFLHQFGTANNNLSFAFEEPNPVVFVDELQQTEEILNGGFSTSNNVDIVIPGIVTGDTEVKLKFSHNSFSNVGPYTANMELDGATVPAIQITYEAPTPTKVIIGKKESELPIQNQTRGASTTSGAGVIGGISNFTSLDFESTPSGESDYARFNAANYSTSNYFQLLNFNFNIPNNAIIQSITTQLTPKRMGYPGPSTTSFLYQISLTDPDTNITTNINKTSTQFDGGTTNNYQLTLSDTFSNDNFTASSLNNQVVWRIYLRTDITDSYGVTPVIIPNPPNTDVIIAGGPDYYPRIIANYIVPNTPKVIIGKTGPTKVKII